MGASMRNYSIIAGCCFLLLCVAGCSHFRGAGQAASGEPAVFEFPSDGAWHASPWFAHSGEKWSFSPALGQPAQLTRALSARVDQQTWPLDKPLDILIISPGRISFRVDRQWLPEFSSAARVTVCRIAGDSSTDQGSTSLPGARL